MSEVLCEVCNRESSVGVACVPGIPYSAAYGKECLQRGANPYSIIRANVICNGGIEHTAEWFLEQPTFVNGEYTTLKTALEKYPITDDELIFDMEAESEPLPIILFCPLCHYQHIDEIDPALQAWEEQTGQSWQDYPNLELEKPWTNPPHKSHLCLKCGCIWRPADIPTEGVAKIETRGEKDTWPEVKNEGK